MPDDIVKVRRASYKITSRGLLYMDTLLGQFEESGRVYVPIDGGSSGFARPLSKAAVAPPHRVATPSELSREGRLYYIDSDLTATEAKNHLMSRLREVLEYKRMTLNTEVRELNSLIRQAEDELDA